MTFPLDKVFENVYDYSLSLMVPVGPFKFFEFLSLRRTLSFLLQFFPSFGISSSSLLCSSSSCIICGSMFLTNRMSLLFSIFSSSVGETSGPPRLLV